MTDLNSTDSADLNVVFIEAHAINYKGQILVAGRSAHEVGLSGNSVFDDNQHCAPAPPGHLFANTYCFKLIGSAS